ncbi:hypothetical protein M2271_003318 [Streptomyces sp. LBL]|nr:hypothetical protein [Streptomyces sp. LBL]
MRRYPSRRAVVGSGLTAMATMSALTAASTRSASTRSAATAGAAATDAGDADQRSRALTRARAAYAGLDTYLGAKDGSGLVREQYPAASGDNAYSYEWGRRTPPLPQEPAVAARHSGRGRVSGVRASGTSGGRVEAPNAWRPWRPWRRPEASGGRLRG